MKEDFLHYVWKFQKFSSQGLTSITGAELTIVNTGDSNENSGPDFFNAKILIDNQLWIGNVEIHIKSSDWYVHQHEKDPNYDNVILHVVWVYNADIFRKDNSSIPTLELKSIVDAQVLINYRKLFSKKQKWINCENDFSKIESFFLGNWLDRLFLERLQQKSILIEEDLKASNNHWEGLLFMLLCKNFGLKVNGESFYSISRSVNYSIIKKCYKDTLDLEALLFGQAGLIEDNNEDPYFNLLKDRYSFLKSKYGLQNNSVITPKFFRLRPPNFPTIRLSQLAVLFSKKQSLFSEIIATKKMEEYYSIFDISANTYWDTHYNFGVSSSKRKKGLTKKFIDLIIINTIIPLKFSYAKYIGQDASEEIINLAISISSEENSIIKKFNQLRPLVKDALQSQALLQLKNEYCNKKRCLQCAVGNFLLKK